MHSKPTKVILGGYALNSIVRKCVVACGIHACETYSVDILRAVFLACRYIAEPRLISVLSILLGCQRSVGRVAVGCAFSVSAYGYSLL